MNFNIFIVAVVCYFIGSFPTAYFVGRMFGANVFEEGTRNMGTANVIVLAGWNWAMLVFVGDVLKGAAAILFARSLLGANSAIVVGGVMVVIGHCWSLMAYRITGSLRGGKGAAVWIGVIAVSIPLPQFLLMFVAGAVIAVITRYGVIGILGAIIFQTIVIVGLLFLTPHHLYGLAQVTNSFTFFAVTAVSIILFRHRENMVQIYNGTELKLGDIAPKN